MTSDVSQGQCTECSESLSLAFILLGGIFALFATVATLYFISGVNGSKGKLATIVVLGKISITLCQILTQLGVALQLEWPATFDWFINLLKVFSFDILAFLNIGARALLKSGTIMWVECYSKHLNEKEMVIS